MDVIRVCHVKYVNAKIKTIKNLGHFCPHIILCTFSQKFFYRFQVQQVSFKKFWFYTELEKLLMTSRVFLTNNSKSHTSIQTISVLTDLYFTSTRRNTYHFFLLILINIFALSCNCYCPTQRNRRYYSKYGIF